MFESKMEKLLKQDFSIKCFYPQEYIQEEVLDDISDLFIKCLETGKLPYSRTLNGKLYPQGLNINVINGHNLNSIQKIQMELKNALIDNPTQEWIFGSDAVALGLKLKQNKVKLNETDRYKNHIGIPLSTNVRLRPVTSGGLNNEVDLSGYGHEGIYATPNVKEKYGLRTQIVYGLSQFTDESLRSIFEKKENSHLKKMISSGDNTKNDEFIELRDSPLLKKMISSKTDFFSFIYSRFMKNICNVDKDDYLSNLKGENLLKNLSLNTTGNKILIKKLNERLKLIISKNVNNKELMQVQKKCFFTIFEYNTIQQTGKSLYGNKGFIPATINNFKFLYENCNKKDFLNLVYSATDLTNHAVHENCNLEEKFKMNEENYKPSNYELFDKNYPMYDLKHAGTLLNKKENTISQRY